jgi:hypothetical protein
MTVLKWVIVGSAILATASVCPAQQQQKFPLLPGEWEVSTTAEGAKEPVVLRVCLNDDLWTRSLAPSPKCSIEGLNVTAKGVSYVSDCPTATYDLKSTVEITFEGRDHMVAKGLSEVTSDGNKSTLKSVADYRWKGPTCNPNDVNLKYKPSE